MKKKIEEILNEYYYCGSEAEEKEYVDQLLSIFNQELEKREKEAMNLEIAEEIEWLKSSIVLGGDKKDLLRDMKDRLYRCRQLLKDS